MPIVPNRFPTTPHPSLRLAIVGEAPGQDEETAGIPFIGSSGQLLRRTLSHFNLAGEQCFIGNICQHRPPDNDITSFSWFSHEMQSGMQELMANLGAYQPTCILALGRTAFKFFRPDLCYGTEKKEMIPLDNWRGSIIRSAQGYKMVPTYHPAYILRAYGDIAYFRFDVGRAVKQSGIVGLPEVQRFGIIRPTFQQACDYLIRLRQNRQIVSCDLEGYPDSVGITMFSFAPTPYEGIVIPFWIDGHNYWSDSEEPIIWKLVADLLADPDVPKECHNNFYERFVSAWRHRMVINNVDQDTMLKQWEYFPELQKSLGVTASFWTQEPYYKDDRLSNDSDVKLTYNFKDSAVTREASANMEPALAAIPTSYAHYRFNIRITPAISFLNIRGCRLDRDKLYQHTQRVETEIAELQAQIDSAILPYATAAGVITVKRKSDTPSFNVKSVDQKKWLLYDYLKYKPSGRYGQVTDEGALIDYWVKHKDPIVQLVIKCVRKRTRLSDINKLVCDSDGRIRTSLDLVGTNTGRLSSRSAMAMAPVLNASGQVTEWVNTGTNLQNVTKELRDCFVPDDANHDFWQFDLAGADGWTVAADLAALGHPAMLEDYLAGIKPAKVLMLLLGEYEAGRNPALLNNLPRHEIKARCDSLVIIEGERDSSGRPSDWKYLCCKKVQHGTNYDGKPPTIARLVFEDSDGAVNLTPQEVGIYQHLYKLRYKPDVRNDWIRRTLSEKGYLVAAAGIRRNFYGIRSRNAIDDAIVREASAFEPQANTTYATNLALDKLWHDPENRQSSGWLRVEPLLQIHDALAGQYHSSLRSWVPERFRTYFNNPILIHGISINIPADGGWGTDWKNCKNKIR